MFLVPLVFFRKNPFEPAGLFLSGPFINERRLVRDDKLFSQRTGHNLIPLAMFGDELHFQPDELTYIRPVRDGGQVIALDYYRNGEGPPVRYPRIGLAPAVRP